ncbi:hypothetical protein ASPVEDRAFT_79657 [Aspergillus versicolor CBS 583.65]|uniref:Ecp2 effector protein domain-containing protein n=1 Tax=Aspergillus versicolor CBS 583.65 TaxID=1036611 RepID=A0A1L9P923_ASPVE|nr:uncharacterized protein ASPVEDRAFT_79657 [Aspergillus versicolor CBS 583.65]OJI97986.1 hypothetical protein ASPVEDRAFT_79657 [Aspergillus versicolor CBS 583.65]
MHSFMTLLLAVLALTAFAAPNQPSPPATVKVPSSFFDAPIEQPDNQVNSTNFMLREYEHVTCGDWGSVDVPEIEVGIQYLRGVKGEPHLDGHTCERVSCSWNSGIYWCNDRNTHRHLPGYYNIADGAAEIYRICQPVFGSTGTLYHNDDWRVLIAKPRGNGDDKNC